MFVVVVRGFWSDRIVGPFISKPKAIAYAVNTYGWASSGYAWNWCVRPLEEA